MNPRADWLIGLPVSPIGALVHIHMLPIFSWLCENLAGPNARLVTRTCKISCLVMRVQAHGICGMFSFYCVFKSTRLKLQINFVFTCKAPFLSIDLLSVISEFVFFMIFLKWKILCWNV